MEERYVVVRVDQNHVVDDGFLSADEALARAKAFYANSGVECYAARLVPIELDKKSSLVILREQTAAIADTTTSTRTRTEQIYHELTAMRAVWEEALAAGKEFIAAEGKAS
jgi:hypothetical protein